MAVAAAAPEFGNRCLSVGISRSGAEAAGHSCVLDLREMGHGLLCVVVCRCCCCQYCLVKVSSGTLTVVECSVG